MTHIASFKDICLGKERSFDLVVTWEKKINGHTIVYAKDIYKDTYGDKYVFFYIIIDGFIKRCFVNSETAVIVWKRCCRMLKDGEEIKI